MFTEEQIENNFNRFKELITKINRPNFNKVQFLNMLDSTDFKVAPASTKYHNDIPGGLCAHCLNVYDNFNKFVEEKQLIVTDPDSLIIIPLFHDLDKINMYKVSSRNVKHYCTEEEYNANPKAYKAYDEIGNYKWQAVKCYERVEPDARVIYGNHEETCEYIARSYIQLRREESIAILHHSGGINFDSTQMNLYDIYRKYPLAFALFIADYTATIIDEECE